jgi:predicted metal-dependent phosphoesterase TrpH
VSHPHVHAQTVFSLSAETRILIQPVLINIPGERIWWVDVWKWNEASPILPHQFTEAEAAANNQRRYQVDGFS